MKSGCVHYEKPKEGVELPIEMKDIGMQANEVNIVNVLAACANLTVLEFGRNVRVLDTLIISGGGTFKGKNGVKVLS